VHRSTADEQRVRQRLTIDKLLLPGGIAVLATPGVAGEFWRPALLPAAAPYGAPAFVLLVAGFWQHGDMEAHNPNNKPSVA